METHMLLANNRKMKKERGIGGGRWEGAEERREEEVVDV